MNTTVKEMKGFKYIDNFITNEEHDFFLQQIDASTWQNELKRRVQHYGFMYDYKKHKVDLSMKIGDLPSWILLLADKIHAEGLVNYVPDQAIVNEYQAGQGIAPHIDCRHCFEDTIISLSLLSSCIMDFTKLENKDLKIHKLLEPCSLVILQGEARYEWLHSIKPNKTYRYNGKNIARKRRVSLTLRKVKES